MLVILLIIEASTLCTFPGRKRIDKAQTEGCFLLNVGAYQWNVLEEFDLLAWLLPKP